MHKKIFQSSFLTAFLVLITTIALIMGVLFHFLRNRSRKSLRMKQAIFHRQLKKQASVFLTDLRNRRIGLL